MIAGRSASYLQLRRAWASSSAKEILRLIARLRSAPASA
jgi:hypothetical protein